MSGDAVARDSPNITFVETNEVLEQDRIFVIDNLLLYSSQIPAARPCELIVSRIAAGNGCRNRFVLLFEFGPSASSCATSSGLYCFVSSATFSSSLARN